MIAARRIGSCSRHAESCSGTSAWDISRGDGVSNTWIGNAGRRTWRRLPDQERKFRHQSGTINVRQTPSTRHGARDMSREVVQDANTQYPRQGSNL